MQSPKPVHLMTPEESRALGWAAEERDSDGHLISQHAEFDSDNDIAWYVREAMKRGGTVTIWPHQIAQEPTQCP